MTARLIVFGGLPGTGKTTLSRQTARALRAVYVRVDSVEQAFLRAAPALTDVGGSGYAAALAVALDNLDAGLDAVVDCVNPLPVTRAMFRSAVRARPVRLIEIEVLCSDAAEHRRRVETRLADIPGHRMPSWAEVKARDYAEWDGPVLRFDTADRSIAEVLGGILAALDASA